MKKVISLCLCMMLLLAGFPVSAAADVSIVRQPQSPTYPEYSVARYTVEVYGDDVTCTWYLTFEGQTYNISDTGGSAKPWEWYAGENYGATREGNNFIYTFSGIESELSGAEIYCEISGAGRTVTSSKAVISVGGEAMPPETRVPSSMSVMQGDALDLYCQASSPDSSVLSYVWYTTPTGRLHDITAVNRGAETSDTIRCDTSSTGTTYYVCMVTTSAGGRAYTSVIPVTVSAPAATTTTTQHTHQYCDWMVLTQPSCTQYGQRLRECDCGHEDREDIPPTGHKWDSGTVIDGTFVLTCTVCGETSVETAPAVSDSAVPTTAQPTAVPAPQSENKGMPWWGTVLIALGAAGAGVGAAYVLFTKKPKGSKYADPFDRDEDFM